MENKKVKILAIDDNRDNLSNLKALIMDAFSNATILTSLTGKEGLELAETEDPDVIILETIMPEMDGFEICERLKRDNRLRDIPIVFLTGNERDRESRIKALECGAEAFLAKPLDEIELTAQIRAMLKVRAANIQKRNENQLLTLLVEEKTRELKDANIKMQGLLEAVKQSEERYKILFENSGVAIGYFTIEGVVISYNNSALENLGGKLEDYIGKSIAEFFPEKDAEMLLERIKKAALSDQPRGYEYCLDLNSGRKWFFSIYSKVIHATGEVIGVQAATMDISERKKAESELLFLSYHDYLTGLYNRRFFEEELKRLDIKQNIPLSIIIFDVNGLKLVNDSFGHDIGDLLLRNAAEAIQKACRKDDIIARLGGDEFVVLLPKTSEDETEKISKHIKEMASRVEVGNIELSISYGYDTKTTVKQSIFEVIANAENHMYQHKLYESSSMRSRTIDLIMNTLFEKSNREAAHSNRVGSICQSIAVKMNLDKESLNQLRIAGFIHDIGKIGIDEKILNKPGRLTKDEKSEIERHPEIGWRILSSTKEFSELAQVVLNHHEKWDGSGYPNGLKGEEIQLEARIISVADAYDAMTSERSYRKELNKTDAIIELTRCSGTQFDPNIVKIFVTQVLEDI